jgi:hypothetical protein
LVELEKQTGELARESFDFIAGTSTGALLTAAIAAGVPATRSLDVYLNDGKRIFSPESSIERNIELVAKGRQFDVAVLHQVVQLTLGVPAYDWVINDCPIPLLITGTDTAGNPVYFTQDRPTNSGKFGNYGLVDAAVASASATTYHDPWKCGTLGAVADGGCSSNADPVYQGCVEAFQGHMCYGTIDPAEATVISLGTGFYAPRNVPVPPRTLLQRVAWVTSALVGSSKTIAAQSVDRHWPGVLQVFNPLIPIDIDEADVSAIPLLLQIGQAAAAKMDWAKILAGGK